MAQKPVRYQCNQPRSVRAGNLAPESSHVQSFSFSCDVVFSLMVDITSLFMSLFQRHIQVKPKYWANLLKYISKLSDFRQSVRSVKERKCKKKKTKKHWKLCAKGNDVITNVICANQHLASTFSMQIFKFQRRSCCWSPPSFSRPAARAPRTAYSQVYPGLQLRVQLLLHSISVACRYGRATI